MALLADQETVNSVALFTVPFCGWITYAFTVGGLLTLAMGHRPHAELSAKLYLLTGAGCLMSEIALVLLLLSAGRRTRLFLASISLSLWLAALASLLIERVALSRDWNPEYDAPFILWSAAAIFLWLYCAKRTTRSRTALPSST